MNLKKLSGLLLLAAAVCAPSASAVTYEPEPTAFCERQTLRDFLKPLERMPKLHAPRAGGHIDIGPANLRLRPTSRFQVGGGSVGFTLSAAQRKPLRLAWTATTTLVEVNRNGKPIGKAKRSERRVGKLKPYRGNSFQLGVPARAAFYRVTIAFHGRTGQELESFGAYYRVLRPFHRSRLATNASAYRPESTVFARVENYGTLPVNYGVPYAIERLEGSTWVEAPESPNGPWILPLYTSNPGETGGCTRFWIPPSMAAGTYRMVKEVGLVKREETTLTAEFTVVR
ncbi:MAG: hypothetical protein M3335_09710 [Actinomycetota bacterium]|nr:hypothetical protein [Actinomycetota bacterium]